MFSSRGRGISPAERGGTILVERNPGGCSTHAGWPLVYLAPGVGSFYGNDDPLIVIDEVPQQPGSHGVAFLNPHDIERIDVLKNPADTGIYGMRGANGVIKIRTKRPGRP